MAFKHYLEISKVQWYCIEYVRHVYELKEAQNKLNWFNLPQNIARFGEHERAYAFREYIRRGHIVEHYQYTLVVNYNFSQERLEKLAELSQICEFKDTYDDTHIHLELSNYDWYAGLRKVTKE